MIAAQTGRLLTSITVGTAPHAIAIDPVAERVLVAEEGPVDSNGNYHSGQVAIINAHTGQLVETLSFPDSPYAVAVDARLGRALVLAVSNETNPTLTVLDTHTGAVVARRSYFSADLDPTITLVDGHAGRGYVLIDNSSSDSSGLVYVVSTRDGRLSHTLRVGSYPEAAVLSGRTRQLFVANSDVANLASSHPANDTVTVIDTTKEVASRTITVGVSPSTVALNPPTGHIFVINDGSNTVSTMDARTDRVLDVTVVGKEPWHAVASQSRPLVYVANIQDGTVNVLNAWSGRVVASVPTGKTPYGLAIDDLSGHVFVSNDDSSTVSMIEESRFH